MSDEIKNMFLDLKNELRNINGKIHNIDSKFDKLQADQDMIVSRLDEFDRRINFFDREMRKRNLIFFGISDNEHSYFEIENTIVNIVKTKLKIDDFSVNDINLVKRLGRRSDNKCRPVLVELVSLRIKLIILKKKGLLNPSPIYIKEDYPRHIQEIRKRLQPEVNKLRSEGKNAIIKYDKIVILNNTTNTATPISTRSNTRKDHNRDSESTDTDVAPSTTLISGHKNSQKNKKRKTSANSDQLTLQQLWKSPHEQSVIPSQSLNLQPNLESLNENGEKLKPKFKVQKTGDRINQRRNSMDNFVQRTRKKSNEENAMINIDTTKN